MKKIGIAILSCFVAFALCAQATKLDVSGKTDKLVKGTVFKDGQIEVKAGYEMKLSDDKKRLPLACLPAVVL